MLEKYKNLKSKKRVTFHLGACSLLFFVFGIIAKEYLISVILLIIFAICLIIYLLSTKKMEEIEIIFLKNCVKCNKNISYKEEIKHLLYGQNVSKEAFDNDITNEKQKIKIKKYVCNNCHLCFSIVEIYQLNNKGTFSLMKKEKHLLEDYIEKD